jgi:hypothetical protein
MLERYTARAPLLLLTDYPPAAGGGGAVILRSLLPGDLRQRVLWASPSMTEPPGPLEIGLRQGSLGLPAILGRRLATRSATLDGLLSWRLAREVERVAGQCQARALWIVMHGAMVHVAARLLSRPSLPVHLSVHDDPAFGVALMSRRHVALLPLIERDFEFALRRARSVDVVCEGMARRYRQRYGIASTIVHRGIAEPVLKRPPHVAGGSLEIGVMGNTYGYDQLPLLGRAVAGAASRVGARGRIVMIGEGPGRRLRAEVGDRIDVEVTGHLDERRAVERLSRCFALYLSYPFSRRAEVLRQTSFPTKLSSYLLAARPLFVHAPLDSSIAHLAAMTDYVAWWGNEGIDDGVTQLTRLWSLPSAHASQDVAAERLRRSHYDLHANQAALLEPLDALVPPFAEA